MGNDQAQQQRANQIINAIPWGSVHSLRYHDNNKCLHHSYFYFGQDPANGKYYGSYARHLPPDAAANVDFELVGPTYSVCWHKPFFGDVQIRFSNPQREHKLELTLFQNRLLQITVVEGLILPAKTHLHIHLQ